MTDQKKYHINIFSSLWAICPPGYKPFEKICCIKPDGMLDEEKYRLFMEEFAACGANNTRCLPFLVNEDRETIHPESGLLPFKVLSDHSGYNLTNYSRRYFGNLRKMAQIANSVGIRFWFSLFSVAHGNRENSPWVRNNLRIDGFHELSKVFVNRYIDLVLDALSGQVFGIEVVNEPNAVEMASLIRDSCLHLLKRGILKEQIMPGHQFPVEGSPGYVAPVYGAVKKQLKRTGFHFDSKGDYKSVYYSKVIHGMTGILYKVYAHVQKHTSRTFLSNDGLKNPRWNAVMWADALRNFFTESVVSVSKNKQLKFGMGIEHLCTIPFDATEKEEKGIRRGALGIAKAYEEYTGIKLYSIGDSPDPEPSIEDRVTSLEKRVLILEQKK